MPKKVTDRVAEHRRRQKEAGFVYVSLVVPKEDARFFREMATTSRQKKRVQKESYRQPREVEARTMSLLQLKQAERWAAASGLKMRLSTPGLKLSEVLARNIALEIVRNDYPIGRNLGSERELLARYGVGRNLLREAIRKLEALSIAEMKLGNNGGLIVSEPGIDSTAYFLGIYLELRKFTRPDLQRMRRNVQMLVLDRCVEEPDPSARAVLRTVLEAETRLDRQAGSSDFQRLHLTMARMTRDPLLELLMDLALRLYRFHFRTHAAHDPKVATEMRKMHRDIVAAVLAGNRAAARRAMSRHLDYIDSWLA